MQQSDLVLPAIFRYDRDYAGYEVLFPDLPCGTCGKTLEEAFLMACDLVALFLDHPFPTADWQLPAPTPYAVALQQAREGDIVLLVRPAYYVRSESAD